MLKKLLKYDLLNVYKFLIIFYTIVITLAITTRIFLSFDNSLILNIIGQICSGATISMLISLIINNLMRIWVRFTKNIYGDESYLTHTLPISKEKHYLSKFLTALITMLTSTIVIGLSLFIAYYSKENLLSLKNILLPIANIYNSSILKLIISIFFIFFLEMLSLLQSGLCGIILGHKKNHNKIIYSVIFSFIIYIGTQIICLLSLFLFSLFNNDIYTLFTSNTLNNPNIINTILYLAIFIYSLLIIIVYIINIKIFKKGVNVD